MLIGGFLIYVVAAEAVVIPFFILGPSIVVSTIIGVSPILLPINILNPFVMNIYEKPPILQMLIGEILVY